MCWSRCLNDRAKGPFRHSGFTLVEILIVVMILGILAAIVVPQFTSASSVARQNTLKDELRYLRTQIVIYSAQHEDVPPGLDNNLDVQLTSTTRSNGSAGTEFGPYLSKMPTNPVNGKWDIQYVSGSQLTPDGTTGWLYRPATQEIVPNLVGNDSSGTPYVDY